MEILRTYWSVKTMGFFGKDYTDEFKELKKAIAKQSEQNKEARKAIEKIEPAFIRLNNKVDKLQSSIEELTKVVKELNKPEIIQADPEPKKVSPDAHISQYKRFYYYKLPRYYNIDKAKFYSIGGNGSKRYFDLTFQQLVAIIKAYQKGLKVTEMKINPVLETMSRTNIRNYINIWRAGGFNNAIEKVARELGFNPKKLICHECDDL